MSAGANHFAPSFKIEINGQGLVADISKLIQQVSVTNTAAPNQLDSFSFTVVNLYPQMRWTHLEKDARLFAIGNTVTIKMGYVGAEEKMISGEITGVGAEFSEGGPPTLSVDGNTLLHRLDRRQRTREFRDRTDKQIVEQIAGEYGLAAQVKDGKGAQTVHCRLEQNNKTDLGFLRERTSDIGYEIRLEDKTLIVSPGTKTVVAELEWGKNLRSFRPSKNAHGQISQVIVRGYDPKAKHAIIGRSTASAGGASSGPAVAEKAFGVGEVLAVETPPESQAEADQLAQAEYERRCRNFLTASGATIGLPALRAGHLVAIKGLGMFNGKYSLTSVTHTLGGGGYSTNFNGAWIEP